MKRICDLTPDELQGYLQDLARATRCVVSPGADFIVIVIDENSIGNFVGSVPDARAVEILQKVASEIQKRHSETN